MLLKELCCRPNCYKKINHSSTAKIILQYRFLQPIAALLAIIIMSFCQQYFEAMIFKKLSVYPLASMLKLSIDFFLPKIVLN